MKTVQLESKKPTTSSPVTTSSPGTVVTNVQLESKMPTTSSPKPPRDIYDLLGWEVVFTGMTDFPYLNGEPGYAAGYGKTGHGLLRVRVDSARAKMKGCPALLDCAFANLIAIKKGDPFSIKKGKKGGAAALDAALLASSCRRIS